MQRTVLSRLAIAVAAVVGAGLCIASPAAATPSTPSTPSTPTTAAGPTTPTDPIAPVTRPALQRAVAQSASSVLIVHVSGDARSLNAAVAGAAQSRATTVRHTFGATHTFSVAVPASSVAAETTRLNNLPGVSSVETPVVRTFDTSATNDPDLPKQQSYLNAVQAPSVWAHQHGSPTVKIAVVDSGVDVGHPDLAGKIVATYNATDGSTDVTDQVGHGTFVSGVAAADTDNAVGVAGVGYNTDLLAVKVADSSGGIEIDDEVAGIRWAAAHGANIINLSLGGPDSSAAEASAVAYAQHKGVLVVAAAGNEGNTVKQYPAAYPGVVAVGATDPAHSSRADFSSYGSWVTLAAPGVNIYSTVPRAGSQFWPKAQYPNGYANGDGTSFSTPIVSGEAALLKAQNPHLTLARLRAVLVESAHGYGRRGLGAGQVDFARGLAHVPPTTRPSAVHVNGTAGRITLTATSTAREVAFKIGSAPALQPVKVSGGTASVTFPSWGYPNGTSTLAAYDCTAYGECGSPATTTTFVLANPAATITAPLAGHTVTGRFTVRATNSGGPLRLLVDGRQIGLVKSAPYAFAYTASALVDGTRRLTTQACSVDGRYCRGPLSKAVAITAAGLHPTIRSVSPSHISPNGDGVRDTTKITFALADTEHVQLRIVNAAGTTLRLHSLGTLGRGAHSWTWSGKTGAGKRVADGTDHIVLETARGPRRGWVTTAIVVDTRRPSLSHPSGANSLFYPYKDGYRDTFTTHTTLSAAGTLKLTIRTTKGRLVRTITAKRGRGPAAISWTGRDRHGTRVPAGTYTWQLTLTDPAGNTGHTSRYHVRVSSKRLTHTTLSIVKHGARYDAAGGTASCASVHKTDSVFSSGARLVNGCSAASFDLAFAQYTFTVPKAASYSKISIQVSGRATHHASELTAAFEATDGSLEVPGYRTVKPAATAWYSIASVPAAQNITAFHHVYVTVILDSTYAGVNDFDLQSARVRVSAVVLR